MLFIISIIVVFAIVLLLHKQIKNHAVIFYVLTTLITIGFIAYSQLKLGQYVTNPVLSTAISLFSRSALSVAMFTVVMYTGVLNKKSNITKILYSIRGELSIIASILTLGHNVVFGIGIFPAFFKSPSSLGGPKAAASLISLIMIILMLVLMVTSFKCVRSKMNFKTWKTIQRSAYLFYGLIYAHIMCLFLPKISVQTKLNNIIAYSVVFIGYFILRIMKYFRDKRKKLQLSK